MTAGDRGRAGAVAGERAHQVDIDTDRLAFLSAVQHDLSTPVAVIRGWADTLVRAGRDLDRASWQRGIETIHRHARVLTDVLEALFVDLRAEVLARSPGVGSTDLAAVVAHAAAICPRATVVADLPPTPVAVGAATLDVLVRALVDGLACAAEDARVEVTADDRDDGPVEVTFRVAAVELPASPFDPFPGGEPSPSGIRLRAARELAGVVGGEVEPVTGGPLTLRLRLPRV